MIMDNLYFFLMHMNPEWVPPQAKRRYRQSVKCGQDPLATSIRDHTWRDFWLCGKDPWRRVFRKDNYESWYEYVIMPDFEEESDEELQRSIEELEVHICSPYDCTGKPFTRFIHWKRTKAGVVIIRHMSVDV